MNTFRLVAIILSSLIGAGFVTGKELQVFFVRYGTMGIVFAFIFVLLFCLTITYFLFADIGNTHKVVSFLLLVSSVVIISSMISAIGEIVSFTGVPYVLCIAIVSLCSLWFVSFGISFFSAFGVVVLPIIIVVYSLVCAKNFRPIAESNTLINFLSPLMYLGFNLSFTSLLVNKYKSRFTCRQKFTAVAIVGVVVILLLILALFAIPTDPCIDIPMLYLSGNISNTLTYFVALIIVFSAFTTIITTLFSLSTFVKYLPEKWTMRLVMILAFVVSIFGFSGIVSYLYSIMGVIGVGVVIYYICTSSLKKHC